MLILNSGGTEANATLWEIALISITLQEKFRDGPRGQEADWLDKAFFSYQSTASWYRWAKL